MQDARLRVIEAAALAWTDIERVRSGSGRVCPGCWGDQLLCGECRHDEAPVAGPPRRWLGRVRPRHGTEPDSHTDRRGGKTGGVGRGPPQGQPFPAG